MQRALNIVLVAWAGSLWTICLIVAPSLFAVLPNRQAAGELAGHFFRLETGLGLVFGSVSLLLLRLTRTSSNRLDYLLVLVTMLAPLVSELLIRPLMNAARLAGDMAQFGALHGISALLFLAACLTAVMAVWRLLPARD